MTFTYDDPNASDLEAVRYRIQDTDSDRPLLTDEEIEYELAESGNNVLQAVLSCAETLVARGARNVTKKIGQMTINYSDFTAQYVQLVQILQAKIQRGGLVISIPTIGTITDSENYPEIFEQTDMSKPDWDEE